MNLRWFPFNWSQVLKISSERDTSLSRERVAQVRNSLDYLHVSSKSAAWDSTIRATSCKSPSTDSVVGQRPAP